MGITDHRQRVSRNRSTRVKNRSQTIEGPWTTQKIGSRTAYDTYTYNVVGRRALYWESPLVQGNFKDPNSHHYYKWQFVNPIATFGFESLNTDFFSELSGPCANWFQFKSWLEKNEYNPFDGDIHGRTRRRAYNKFFSQLKDQSANLAVDVAEFGQSRDMVAKRCKQLSKMFKDLKKLSYRWWKNLLWNRSNPNKPPRWVPAKHRDAERPLDIVSNTWLEWKLGWSPLLGSIYGVADHVRNRAKRFRIKASAKSREIFRFQPRMQSAGQFVAWSDVELSSYATCCADYQVSSPLLNDVTRLTSLNFIAIAWELVPFSFVYDYIVNIGRYLEELETSMVNGLTFLRGYETVTARYLNKITVPQLGSVFDSYRYYQRGVAPGKEYFISKQRTKWYQTPLPFAPRFEPKIGAERVLTLAALVNQLFFSKGAFK